ncbi:hypothetical protein HK104_000349 [Borealophlyctis nickersoniae]|nr:hypothetical protein HK104_000349 [Borealophlyctis nickersoniae]
MFPPASIPPAISNLIAKHSLSLHPDWLHQCIDYVRSTSPQPLTQTALADLVFEQFLNIDLAESGLPVLPANVGQPETHKIVIGATSRLAGGEGAPGAVVLQLIDITEVGVSAQSLLDHVLEQKWRTWDAVAEFPRKMLKLVLTDGTQAVSAMEYASIHGLSLKSPLGMKIKVRNGLVCRGVLMLEAKNVEILGGRVAELDSEDPLLRLEDRLRSILQYVLEAMNCGLLSPWAWSEKERTFMETFEIRMRAEADGLPIPQEVGGHRREQAPQPTRRAPSTSRNTGAAVNHANVVVQRRDGRPTHDPGLSDETEYDDMDFDEAALLAVEEAEQAALAYQSAGSSTDGGVRERNGSDRFEPAFLHSGGASGEDGKGRRTSPEYDPDWDDFEEDIPLTRTIQGNALAAARQITAPQAPVHPVQRPSSLSTTQSIPRRVPIKTEVSSPPPPRTATHQLSNSSFAPKPVPQHRQHPHIKKEFSPSPSGAGSHQPNPSSSRNPRMPNNLVTSEFSSAPPHPSAGIHTRGLSHSTYSTPPAPQSLHQPPPLRPQQRTPPNFPYSHPIGSNDDDDELIVTGYKPSPSGKSVTPQRVIDLCDDDDDEDNNCEDRGGADVVRSEGVPSPAKKVKLESGVTGIGGEESRWERSGDVVMELAVDGRKVRRLCELEEIIGGGGMSTVYVKARVASQEKMRVGVERGFSLVAVLTDGTTSIRVVFGNKILTELNGMTVIEFKERAKREFRPFIDESWRRLKQKLGNMDGVMELDLSKCRGRGEGVEGGDGMPEVVAYADLG